MIRTNFYLSEVQITRLKVLARQTGLSVAELIRRAIDAFLGNPGDRKGGESKGSG